MPSKQAFRVVDEVWGTFSVRVQKVDLVGLGLNPQVKHSICDSNSPSMGKPSSLHPPLAPLQTISSEWSEALKPPA
jgi:hypothetical protein